LGKVTPTDIDFLIKLPIIYNGIPSPPQIQLIRGSSQAYQ